MSTVEHITFSSHLSQASPRISSVGFACMEQTVLNRKLFQFKQLISATPTFGEKFDR